MVNSVQIPDARWILEAADIDRDDAAWMLCKDYDLQAVLWFVADRDGVRDWDTLSGAPRGELAIEKWWDLVRKRLDADADLRTPFGAATCVVVAVATDGTVHVVTWSKAKADCDAMQGWSDKLLEQVTAIPFATVFGWGNGGEPLPLTAAQIAKLTPRHLEWAKGMM